MATIIGGIGTTHVPSIGKAIAEGKQNDPYWKPFFDGFDSVHRWLAREKPDVAVVFYNDHGLNFFLDKLPTFAVGAASEYRNEDEGWGIPVSRRSRATPALSWHMINTLVGDEFDITMCQEMLVDHAVTIPMAADVAGRGAWPVKIVPVVDQHRAASAALAGALPRSSAARSAAPSTTYPEDLKVVVIGTGGLSHQLDGKRAGFINKEFDKLCMDKLVARPGGADALLDPADRRARRRAGRGVPQLDGDARRAHRHSVAKLHRNYHIPISNTAAATMVLENRPLAGLRAA